jgi:integrase
MAGLPSELTGMDLRRTAITQMVEAGSDQFEIMQVSGHANPSSVTPYLVNTFTGASNALAKRWEKKNE